MGTHPIFESDFDCLTDRMTDVLRELNFNYANLEKDLNRYLARLNFDQLEEVTNFHASSQIESNETGRLLRRDVKVIKDEVVQCAVLIDSLTNQNQLHSEHQVLTEKLEEKLNNVQQKLFGFKSESRDAYDNLIGQDDVLSREIKVMTTRVDAFEREALPRYTSQSKGVPKPSGGGGDNVTSRLVDSNRPEAVQRFQNFQAKRGKTDGWNSVDHNNFIRMWDKHCDQAGDIWDEEKFVMLVEVELPGRSETDIIKHIKFYRTFIKLRKDQQREIEAWKAAKRANTLRRSIDEAIEETARKSPRKLNPKEELERQNRLEKLEKWKREKEMKKREEQLRTQREIEAEQKRRTEEARDRERILKLREIEREHRKQSEKLIKEAEEREMKEERRRKANEINQKIKEVTAKDIYARQIEVNSRKQREREAKIKEEIDRLKRQKRQDHLADFDPSRLYQSTMSQRIRLTAKEEKPVNTGRNFILQSGGRAQVSWRNGL